MSADATPSLFIHRFFLKIISAQASNPCVNFFPGRECWQSANESFEMFFLCGFAIRNGSRFRGFRGPFPHFSRSYFNCYGLLAASQCASERLLRGSMRFLSGYDRNCRDSR